MTWLKYKELIEALSHISCKTQVLLNNFKEERIDKEEFREDLYSISFQYHGFARILIDLLEADDTPKSAT